MTTATITPTGDAIIAELQRELDARKDPSDMQAKVNAYITHTDSIAQRLQTIRSATAALANVAPRIAAEIEWRDHLIEWRRTLCDELLAFPPRIRDDRDLGKQQNVKQSITAIDRGGLSYGGSYGLCSLRLGALMRAAGYVESPKIENQVCGRLPWFGSMPEVERRLKALEQQRDDAQARLDEALREPVTA
jgi:hypothetical protein